MRSLTWSNGGKYVGEWKDNKQWNGTIYAPNGNIIGKYVNGLKVEKRRNVVFFEREVDGVLGWYENGDEREDTKFIGEFKNGKYSGKGTFLWGKGSFEGEKYVGEFLKGKRSGLGTYTFSNGDIDHGIWAKGKLIERIEIGKKKLKKQTFRH